MQLTVRFVLAALLACSFRGVFALPVDISDATSLDARALEDESAIEAREFEELDARERGVFRLEHNLHDGHHEILNHGFEGRIHPEIHHPEIHRLHLGPREVEAREFEELDARERGAFRLEHNLHDGHHEILNHGFEGRIHPDIHYHPEVHRLHLGPREVETREFEELDARERGAFRLEYNLHDGHHEILNHGFEGRIHPDIHYHPEVHRLHLGPREVEAREFEELGARERGVFRLEHNLHDGHHEILNHGFEGRIHPEIHYHPEIQRLRLGPRDIRQKEFKNTLRHESPAFLAEGHRFEHVPLRHKLDRVNLHAEQGLEFNRLNGASLRHGAGLRQNTRHLGPAIRDRNRRSLAQ